MEAGEGFIGMLHFFFFETSVLLLWRPLEIIVDPTALLAPWPNTKRQEAAISDLYPLGTCITELVPLIGPIISSTSIGCMLDHSSEMTAPEYNSEPKMVSVKLH